MTRAKDLWLSFMAGLVTAFFLLLVFPNIQALAFIENYKFWFGIAVPFVFLAGYWIMAKLSVIPTFSILRQVGKYGIVGVLNTAIDFGILNLLITFSGITQGVWIAIFNIIAFGGAVVNSFFWNQKWVFEATGKYETAEKFFEFVIVSTLAIIFNTAVVYALTAYVAAPFGLDDKTWINIAKVFATLFSMTWNFLGYKFVVFK